MNNFISFCTRTRHLLLAMVALAGSILPAHAYIYITGPSSVCTNSYAYFSTTYDGCSYSISWSAVQNGTTIGSGTGPSFSFYVSSSIGSISVSMNAYPLYPSSGCTMSYNARSVSVLSGSAPGTPSAVGITHVSGYLYDLSTTSANASSYEWTVSGATIQGSSTGATIRVLASHACYFSFQVRGKVTGCGTYYSSWTSGSKSIAAPAAPDYVSTPVYINNGAQMVSVSASNEPHDPGIFVWSLSDPGGQLTLTPTGGITVYLSHSGVVTPLREAYVNVYRSSACGTSPTRQGLTRYGNNNLRIANPSPVAEQPLAIQLYPNPASSHRAATLTLPQGSRAARISIYDANGQPVSELQGNDTGEVPLSGLARGTYLVKVVLSRTESYVIRYIVQ